MVSRRHVTNASIINIPVACLWLDAADNLDDNIILIVKNLE
jgi:hypothetical protein